jgi:hypothetical protein
LSQGNGSAVFDVTVLLKEILEAETFADGFVLTSGSEGVPGITSEDAGFFASLEGASLDLKTSLLPSGRPQGIPEVE